MVGFPLLLIPVALYNAIVFLMPSVSFTDALFSLTLVSGAAWPVTLSDVLLALGVLLLLLEVIKGARPGAKYLTDHLLSLIVFGAAAAEFLMWPKFATSTYFLLTLLAMTDFLSGIALRAHRGNVAMAAAATAPASPPETADLDGRTHAASVEPKFAHAAAEEPSTGVPAAASIAESVLMDHPEPKIAQPVVTSREPEIEPKNEDVHEHEAELEPELEAKPETGHEAEFKAEPKIPSPQLQPGPGAQEH